MKYDAFICHAREDKDEVVNPLCDGLRSRGFKVWLDDRELRIGDSLLERIESGLNTSAFGVVVLSPAFFAKEWPKKELQALAELEIQRDRKVILPIWHKVSEADVRRRSPLLAGRFAANTARGIPYVLEQVTLVLGLEVATSRKSRYQSHSVKRTAPPTRSPRCNSWLKHAIPLDEMRVRKIVDVLIQTGSFGLTASETGEPMDEVQSVYAMHKESILEAWTRTSKAPPSHDVEDRVVELLKKGYSSARVVRHMTLAIVDVRVIRDRHRDEIKAAWKISGGFIEEPFSNA